MLARRIRTAIEPTTVLILENQCRKPWAVGPCRCVRWLFWTAQALIVASVLAGFGATAYRRADSLWSNLAPSSLIVTALAKS